MKHLSVQKPCFENWEGMTPTEKGAFCQKCAKQVIDFSNQSPTQINSTLLKNRGEETCGRITEKQLTILNNDFQSWRQSNSWSIQRASFYAFLFVFGLSFVSCSTQEDEKQIIQLQETAKSVIEKDRQVVHAKPQRVIEQHQAPILHEIEEVEIEQIIVDDFQHEYLMKDMDAVIPDKVENHEYITMGMMVASTRYLDYIEEQVPEEQYDDQGRLIPEKFNALAFPNPTSGRTTLKFEVPEKAHASFELYSMQGARIKSMGASDYLPGTYEVPFDLSQHKPGTYLIVIQSKGYKESVRVVKM